MQGVDDKSNSAPTSVGMIIYPPPNIKSTIDKAANAVARLGPEFVRRILAKHEGNASFDFFRASDPYHAYYQHRLSEARTLCLVKDQEERTRLHLSSLHI